MTRLRTVNARGEGSRLRQEILDAAALLLSRPPEPDGVTLRAIAREAGIAAPSVYLHFANRDAVLDEVLNEAFKDFAQHMDAAAVKPGKPVQQIRGLCAAYLNYAERFPERYRMLFCRGSGNLSHAHPSYPQGLRAFALLRTALEAAVADGTSASTTPSADSAALLAALHGLVTLVPATPGFPWPETGDLAERMVQTLAALCC